VFDEELGLVADKFTCVLQWNFVWFQFEERYEKRQ